MMYPFMTLPDGTEIVHSQTLPNGEVKVYAEKPDAKDCFHHATCFLPEYKWQDVYGFSKNELSHLDEIIHSTANLILEFTADTKKGPAEASPFFFCVIRAGAGLWASPRSRSGR